MQPIQMTRAQYQAKYGVAPGVSSTQPPVAPTAPVPPSPVAPTTPTAPVQMTRAQYQAKYGVAPTTSTSETAPQDSGSGGFLKSLVSAPATLIARPFQAAANVGDYIGTQIAKSGKTPQEQAAIDAADNARTLNTQSTGLGGIIAPTPQNASDVVKDVGRGVQTVALGAAAPETALSSGAALGFGNALEQGGSNAITTPGGIGNTALQTGLGAVAGKGLGIIGDKVISPILSKVASKIPDVIAQPVSKGVQQVEDYMANHELLGGVAKPLSEKITSGAKAVDTGVNNLFKGAATNLQKTAEPLYINSEQKKWQKIINTPKAAYNDATDIYNTALKGGNDVTSRLAKIGVTQKEVNDGGVFNTLDSAKGIRKTAGEMANNIVTPYLKIADMSVPPVSIQEAKQAAIDSVMRDVKIPDKEAEIAKINKRFNSNAQGSLQERFPNGFTPSDMQMQKVSNANGVNFENPDKNVNFHISNGFRNLLEEKVPPIQIPGSNETFSIKDFNKELQKNYQASDFLESLNNKKVPKGLFAKTSELGGKLLGASLGSTLPGGALTGIAGYHGGGLLMDYFSGMSGPARRYVLANMEREEPAVFKAFTSYLKAQNPTSISGISDLLDKTPRLPAPASAKDMIKNGGVNTLQSNGKPIPAQFPYRETTSGERFNNSQKQNLNQLFNTKQLPAPEARTIVPNTQGTPNKIGRFYGPGGDQGEVGGIRQRIKTKK